MPGSRLPPPFMTGLSPLALLITNACLSARSGGCRETPDGAAYKQQKFTSPGPRDQGWVAVRAASCSLDTTFTTFFACPAGREGTRMLQASIIRPLISIAGAPPSRPNRPPKALPPNTSTWGLGFQWGFGEAQTFRL